MSIAKQFEETLKESGSGLYQQMNRNGLTIAKVTNITDEDGLNRVKCLPIENNEKEETDWCYVLAPLGGKEHGQFFFPNVGDLVVMGYLAGDPHRPLVLGACWNEEIKPPYIIKDGKVHNFSIKTPAGTELLFYDEEGKEKFSITTPSGTTLIMDDENQAVNLSDKDGNNALKLDLKGGNVELKAKTKLTLSAGGTSIVLEDSGKITQTAKSKISMEAATVEAKASSSLALKGSSAEVKADMTLTLQSSGQASLKGAIVKIN